MIYSVQVGDFEGDFPTSREAISAASAHIEANSLPFTSFAVYRSSGSALSGCVLYSWAHKHGDIWF
jgi:hypothetical protein